MRGKIVSLLVLLVVLAVGVSEAGFSGTELYLPSVGSGAGAQGSHWYTTLWLSNPGTSPANVTLQFLARGNSNSSPPTAHETVAPGETIRVADLMADYFGMGSGFGALRITSSAKILACSRIFSMPSGGGEDLSTGQFFGAVPAGFSIGSGESTTVLGGFQLTPPESGPFRYNFGFVETSGNSVTVRVTAYFGPDPTSPVGTKDYTLGAYGVMQKNLSDLISSPSWDNITLKIEVVSGSGRIIAFGSQATNGSNDPSTFEMQFADSLLGGGGGGGGLTQVAHDGTLTGDGTAGSPLGVADGGVTAQKLSASGSSAGQVLMSDGTSVSWQTPSGGGGGGFTLPYAGSTSSSGNAFSVTNTGDGPAIYAESTGHDGIRAKSSAATKSGVYGYTSTQEGYGVYGRNQGSGALGFLGGQDTEWADGRDVDVGVFGRADGAYRLGVLGLSSGTGGYGTAGKELSSGNWGVLGSTDAGVMGSVETSTGEEYGVWGIDHTGGVGFAGAFTGDVAISGSLNVSGTKNFRIDHPLDPANRYLYHAAVESDEVLDQYTGNVVLDGSGRAVVELPDWFEALNTDFRYQLTPIGAPAPNLHVAEGVRDNRFTIAGGAPGMTVSWLITARRNDPFMQAHPFQVERDKPEAVRGSYVDPTSRGLPEELQENWVAHPEVYRRLQLGREREGSSR